MTPTEEAQVQRGVRARVLRRLILRADERAQRRFAAYMAAVDRGESMNGPAGDRYGEAEQLLSRLQEMRYGR